MNMLKHVWINLICIYYLNLKICYMLYTLFLFSYHSCQSSFLKFKRFKLIHLRWPPAVRIKSCLLSYTFHTIDYQEPTSNNVMKMKATVIILVWNSFQSCRPKNFKLLLLHFIAGKGICRTLLIVYLIAKWNNSFLCRINLFITYFETFY